MAAYAAHIPPTKILISYLLNETKQEPHKTTYLSENGGLGEEKKEVRRMGQKQKRIRQKERQD